MTTSSFYDRKVTWLEEDKTENDKTVEDSLAKVSSASEEVGLLQCELSAVHASALQKALCSIGKVQESGNQVIKTLRDELAVKSQILAARDKELAEKEEQLRKLRLTNEDMSKKFAASYAEGQGLRVELEIKTKTLLAGLYECEMQVEDTVSRMMKLLDFERQSGLEASAEVIRLKTCNDELQAQFEGLSKAADESAEKLAQNVKRMALELTTKQTEIQRLASKMELILHERESMKHDFARMMEELTEYRAKLGEKGVKMSPRPSHRVSMESSPAKFSSEKQEEEEMERFKEEEKYLNLHKHDRGKYFMC